MMAFLKVCYLKIFRTHGLTCIRLAEFPPQTEIEQPVDIADPWIAPQSYAEDLYAGGEVLGDTSVLSPSNLTPVLSTPHAEGDVDMAMTPEVLTIFPTQVEEPEASGLSNAGDQPTEPSVFEHGPEMHDSSGFEIAPELVFDPALLEDLYAGLSGDHSLENPTDTLDSAHFSQVGSASNSVGESPSPHRLHDRSSSPPRMSLRGHVDWTWPPAFSGRPTSSSTSYDLDTLDEESVAAPLKHTFSEVFAISDDEEDDEELPANDAAGTVDATLDFGIQAAAVSGSGPEPPTVDVEASQDRSATMSRQDADDAQIRGSSLTDCFVYTF